jgi:hypothetical protein
MLPGQALCGCRHRHLCSSSMASVPVCRRAGASPCSDMQQAPVAHDRAAAASSRLSQQQHWALTCTGLLQVDCGTAALEGASLGCHCGQLQCQGACAAEGAERASGLDAPHWGRVPRLWCAAATQTSAVASSLCRCCCAECTVASARQRLSRGCQATSYGAELCVRMRYINSRCSMGGTSQRPPTHRCLPARLRMLAGAASAYGRSMGTPSRCDAIRCSSREYVTSCILAAMSTSGKRAGTCPHGNCRCA